VNSPAASLRWVGERGSLLRQTRFGEASASGDPCFPHIGRQPHQVSTVTLSASARSHQWLASIVPIAVVVLTKSKSNWIFPFDMFNFDRRFQLKTFCFPLQFVQSGA
jgi:hypothetical protein